MQCGKSTDRRSRRTTDRRGASTAAKCVCMLLVFLYATQRFCMQPLTRASSAATRLSQFHEARATSGEDVGVNSLGASLVRAHVVVGFAFLLEPLGREL